jgi:hypothetical protein
LLNGGGQIVAQGDGPPVGGRYPTTYWLPGEIVEDAHRLTIPSGGHGPYRIAVGLYDPATSARLEARDSQGAPLLDSRVLLESQ